jgi:FtsH-binding integral membrane protein
MEDDVKDFMKRIVWSLSLGLLWLITNLGIGAYNHLLVPDPDFTTGIIIFYIWFVASLGTLIWLLYRIWKNKFH